MSLRTYEKETSVGVPAEALWRWHVAPGALERLTPPWQSMRVEDPGEGVKEGSRVVLRVKTGPFWQRWVALHKDVEEGRGFTDEQIEGPFATWTHQHRFEPDGASRSRLVDHVRYAPPLGAVGAALGGSYLAKTLERLFVYRHAVTRGDLEHQAMAATDRPLRILVTGATGLVGSALVPYLRTAGHTVIPLERGEAKEGTATWHPSKGRIELAPALPLDAVVHLGGANIAGGRWTDERKRLILESRTVGTRLLAEALSALPEKPRVLVTASATGIYGDRADEVLDENSAPGDGFLADVARAWEASSEPAEAAGIRTVHTRFGMILTPRGGALAPLLTPAKLGLGGPIGTGRPFWPWIAMDDVVSVILFAIARDDLAGGINVVAPEAVRQRTFAKTLGRVLSRPAFLPAPRFALRAMLGEMADALLLASQRVEPRRLVEAGYPFRWPTLEGALRHGLGRTLETTS